MKLTLFSVIVILIASCTNHSQLSDVKACKEFIKDDIRVLKATYQSYSKAEFNSIKLSYFYARISNLIEQDSIHKAIEITISTYDTIQPQFQKIEPELVESIARLKENSQINCKVLFDLNKTAQLFFSQVALVESLYIDSPSVQLFQGQTPTLKKDSIYSFEYGLVISQNPFNGNMIVLTDDNFEVSTIGRIGDITENIEIKMLNKLTSQVYTYSDSLKFKIID